MVEKKEQETELKMETWAVNLTEEQKGLTMDTWLINVMGLSKVRSLEEKYAVK